MKTRRSESQEQQCFLQGLLSGLAPVSLLVLSFAPPLLSGGQAVTAGIALPLLLLSGLTILYRFPLWSRILISAGSGLGIFLLFPVLCTDQLFLLFTGVTVIASLFYLFSSRIKPFNASVPELRLERFRGNALALILLTMFSPLFSHDRRLFTFVCLAGLLIMLFSFGSFQRKRKWLLFLLPVPAAAAVFLALKDAVILPAFFLGAAGFCYAMSRKHTDLKYLRIIMDHPGRSVFLTFALLCAAGTLLLRTPAAMNGEISVLDAAFTSVSGVCVTGLSVIDISRELTLTGRLFLMLLIQAGGLGIMTLATLTLHALGKRLSLNQEHLLTELDAAKDQDVLQSLKQIVTVTFFCETLGAALLIPGFFQAHGDWSLAFELGIFTSVSAFCNAGFFPHTDNLMPYAGNHFLLMVTALLIIAGGIAPAVTVSLIQLRKKAYRLPLISKLVIGSTLLLLAGSTFFLLLFEWNGIFSDLTPIGKMVNGFFLAASLRTAGFNTVAMSGCGVPAVIVMLLCMFIGGSPGGTAGGIKNTTLAVLVLTLRAAVQGSGEVVLDRHRIPGKSVIQAVAVVSSAVLVLLIVIVMLVTSQSAGAKELIFESFSALGTVGLSLGITGELDTVGRIIIMATMFIGRIGPLTLFLLLSERRNSGNSSCPSVRIPLG